MGCFLDDRRAFGINADQWTTAAQDVVGKWRRAANKGRDVSCEMNCCRESQGWTKAYSSSMPKRDGKDQGEDSSKQASSCWFARHS